MNHVLMQKLVPTNTLLDLNSSIEDWYYLLLAFPFADFTGLVGFLGLLFFTIVLSDDMNESTGIAARVIISTVPREHRSTEILLIVWLSGASTMLRKS